jgi:hypothetical protein
VLGAGFLLPVLLSCSAFVRSVVPELGLCRWPGALRLEKGRGGGGGGMRRGKKEGGKGGRKHEKVGKGGGGCGGEGVSP